MRDHYPRFMLALAAALALMLVASLAVGSIEIPVANVLAWLGGGDISEEQAAVLAYIRLPRTLVGLMVGAGLAASGTVMQGIFGNPLADPGVIGVSSGAALGAVLAISLGVANVFALPLAALVGSLVAVSLAVGLAMRHGKIPVMTLLLSGVVVGMLFAALTTAVLTVLESHKVQQYLFWTMGGLDYRRWEHVLMGAAPIGGGLLIMNLLARHLNVLAMGEVEAKAVGMSVARYRLGLLTVASLVTATSVCVSGNIGFVGLVVPHMVRMVVGPDHRKLLPASIVAGGLFLVFCDTLGRLVVPPAEVRVGIMTALLGTPYFLYLLRKSSVLE